MQPGGVTIIRYGGGPNGPMRTLAQYMLGSGATFGYEIPDYTSCSVKDSADPHSPRQIFHVDRKCHTDGRHVTIGYRSLRESKATTNDVTQKIPQVTGEQATRLSLSIPNQATTWQLVAIPRTKIAIIPESLPFTRRQGINALHPPSSDEVCLEH